MISNSPWTRLRGRHATRASRGGKETRYRIPAKLPARRAHVGALDACVALEDPRPAERVDLAAAEPAVADSLFRVLQDWMARVGSEGALAARELPETLDPAIRDQLRALGYVR